VFLDRRLQEQHRALRIESGAQPVQKHLAAVGVDLAALVQGGGQHMPVGHHEPAVVGILELHPVFQGPRVISPMQAAGRPHPAEDDAAAGGV